MAIPAQSSLTNSELRTLLVEHRKNNWQGIQTPEWQSRIVDSMVNDDGGTIFAKLAGIWSLPAQATILDVGSGVGAFVVACRRRGLIAFGIEPDRIGKGGGLTAIQIAKRRLENQVFAVAVGERLPFRDKSFDLVALDQVMEHVADQKAVLREAARVLKPGGAIYMASPNYLRFYESHYKIFWLPLLPKMLGRLYLKTRARNAVLLNQLTYTTNSRLSVLARELGAEYSLVDLNQEQFLHKCKHGGFVSSRARLLNRMMRLPVVGRLIGQAALTYLRWTSACEMVILRKPSEAR